MENNERYSPDTGSGMPHVTPEVIEAFKNMPHDFQEQSARFQKTHPEIARLVFIEAEKYARGDIIKKHAFAKGALTIYSLLEQQGEVTILETIHSLTADDDGEDQPL